MNVTCPRCGETGSAKLMNIKGVCFYCREENTASKDPAGDIEAARRHHKMHGDMDGATCLLSKCALHYPS